MTTKYEKLKKKAMIEGGIVAVVLLVMGAIIYVIGSILDDYDESNASMQRRVDAIDLEMRTLQGRFTNIKNNLSLYQEVEKKLNEGRLAIDRKVIVEKFNQYKTQYNLEGLHLSVSPTQDVQSAVFKHKNSNVNFSDINVSFVTTTDEGVYPMIDSFRSELPGLCKMVKITIARQKLLNDEAYLALAKDGAYPMIKTDLHFIWFGVNYIAPPEPVAATRPADKTNVPRN